jgi:Zn-dependent peptidase ImmA (M78 family)
MRLPLESADVDAFSLPFTDRPVIVLSADKNDRARSRFDAAHELGHLVMHGQQIWGLPEVEKQAHRFAAAFLMPRQDIADQLPRHGDWNRLFSLKRHWQVSLAALLMRARVLGSMSENDYVAAIKAASARGWRRIEPVPLGQPEQPKLLQALIRTATARDCKDILPKKVILALEVAAAA